MSNKIICPFCQEEIPKSRSYFECLRCPKDFDEKYALYLCGGDESMVNSMNGSDQAKKHFIDPEGVNGNLRQANCKNCGKPMHKRVCPHCHNEINDGIINGDTTFICVLGSRGSGKSNYLAVLLNELSKVIRPYYTVSALGSSSERWHKFYGSLYNDKPTRIEQTPKLFNTIAGGKFVTDTIYLPFQYIFKTPKNKWCPDFIKEKLDFLDKNIYHSVVFFDAAGEDLADQDSIEIVTKYIAKSDGIIFLVDPFELKKIKEKINPEDATNSAGTSGDIFKQYEHILRLVSNFIRGEKKLGAGDRLDVPLAITLSKLDVVPDTIAPRNLNLFRPSPHEEGLGFIEADSKMIDGEMQSILGSRADINDFIDSVKSDYKNVFLFGVSSYGLNNKPDADGNLKVPEPHRIADPMFWILSHYGIIRRKK